MFCDAVIDGTTCGSNDFDTIRVHREKRYVNNAWKYSAKHDTREIICCACSTRYYTETEITHKVVFDSLRLRSKVIDLYKDKNQLSVFND